jgi:hypothetical protein
VSSITREPGPDLAVDLDARLGTRERRHGVALGVGEGREDVDHLRDDSLAGLAGQRGRLLGRLAPDDVFPDRDELSFPIATNS